MPINPQITLSELDELLAEGKITLAAAHKVLKPRSERKDSRSGKRAQAWMLANPLPKAGRKATKADRKQAVAEVATPKVSKANPHTIAANESGHPKGSAAWWGVYKASSAAARKLANA